MAGKKNTPVVKESRAGDAAKTSETKKPAPQPTNEFISEKSVRLAVLGLVVIIIGYFGYPYAKTLVVSYFSEEEVAVTSSEAPVETTNIPTEEPPEELVVLEPNIEEEFPLEVEVLATKETPRSAVEHEEGSPIPTMAEPALDISPAGDDPQGVDENRFSNLEAEINALKEELAERTVAPDAGTAHFASAVAGLAPPLYQSRTFIGELEQIRERAPLRADGALGVERADDDVPQSGREPGGVLLARHPCASYVWSGPTARERRRTP